MDQFGPRDGESQRLGDDLRQSGHDRRRSNVMVNDVPVASVTVTPAAILMQTAQTRQLTAVIRDAKGNVLTGRILNWSTDRSSVATVSASGLVTGVAPGYATILAASEGVTFGVGVTIEADEVPFDLIYHRTANNGDQQIFTLNPSAGSAPIHVERRQRLAGTVAVADR